MKRVCLIGPFPPPMNGNSKALDTLVSSEEFKKNFSYYKINLNQGAVGQSGRFSFAKVKTTLCAVREVAKHKNEQSDCFYITTAQSKFGFIRDYLIIHCIKRYFPTAKIIAHLHGGGFRNFYNNSPALFKTIAESTYSKIDKVIVLSESLVDMFDGIVPRDKIAIRYNCVDDDFLFSEEEIRNKNDISENINVTYLSNMIETKGYKHVLDAAKKVYDLDAKIRFFFAGSFPNEVAKNEFLKEIDGKMDETVQYLGIVSGDDKKKLLQKTDIFVLPTRYPPEGQPISIIEAMAAGAVIITTDQGGIPDIIKDGVNGFIIKNNYCDEILSRILYIRDNKKIREMISIRNNKYVAERFTEHHYVNGLIEEFNSVIE